MKLSVKITLILFAVITLFLMLISAYFYSAINHNFTRQAEKLMFQSTILMDQRIDLLRENLRTEMEQLASSLFTENENTLAAMLTPSPDFTSDVVGFAEKLRRRTNLNFLYVISADGQILSDSLHPAAFGKSDPRPDFPLDEASFAFDESAHLELKRKVTFGQHTLLLRGGYFLIQNLERLPTHGIQVTFVEFDPTHSVIPSGPPPEYSYMNRTLELKDYLAKPIIRIRVAVSTQELQEQKETLIRNSFWFLVGALGICLLAGYLFSFSVTRPVARLTDAALEMSQGNLEVRVEQTASGEIGSLTAAFNRMAKQLDENQKQLLQSERIAAWQEIARHLAHEIKNPLTPIRTSIANLRLCLEKAPEKFPEIFLESSESILEEVEKLRHLADEFAQFARLPAPILKQGNLNELIHKAILLYGASPPSAENGMPGRTFLYSASGGSDEKVTIRFEPGDLPVFPFDAEQISRVIHNLLQNAVDAVRSNGMISICTGTLRQEGHLLIRLEVQDNGIGMDEQTKERVFTPYFTTKDKGTGLGLPIVHRIISEHRGSIWIESVPGKGTRFEIRLPAS